MSRIIRMCPPAILRDRGAAVGKTRDREANNYVSNLFLPADS